jgi:hypothetical protein
MVPESLEYSAARLPGPVKIDGDWNKAAWRDIPALTLGHHMGKPPAHRPRVSAKLAWDSDALYLIFNVMDRYVRAVARRNQDPVCRDSCVEFFFTPGEGLGTSYFNIEINCGGTMLFWWHPGGGKAVPVSGSDCDCVHVRSTLPKIVDPEIPTPVPWSLECRLPFHILRNYCPAAQQPETGTIWRSNLYKCADDTSHPHWLTWSRVDYPTPRFHLPEYFGILKFK